MKLRSLVVLCVGTVLVLVPFLILVSTGWPGQVNGCVLAVPDSCFCEHFDPQAALHHAAGVRQPVNTWFNLYSLVTSSIVAIRVCLDRRSVQVGPPPNLMRSSTVMPDLYVFCVLFLGLGSMWFHASLTRWGGIIDGLSMYTYAAFLVFYSVRRLWNHAAVFWIGYPGTVALFTVLHAHVSSLVLVLSLVAAYLVVEVIIWVRSGRVMQGKTYTQVLWSNSVAAILVATLFWSMSQTGGRMCWPQSWFQPHGLLWHPLAGVMAVLLYFYWRAADDRSRAA
jgi:hypothetical protein